MLGGEEETANMALLREGGTGETLRSIVADTTPRALASFRTSDDHQNPPKSADIRPGKGVDRQDAEDEIGDGPGEDEGRGYERVR